jgi:hypothetical protein
MDTGSGGGRGGVTIFPVYYCWMLDRVKNRTEEEEEGSTGYRLWNQEFIEEESRGRWSGSESTSARQKACLHQSVVHSGI